MRLVRVTIEWPTGSRVEEIEVTDDATDEDIEEEAKDAFFNLCNYGFEVVS